MISRLLLKSWLLPPLVNIILIALGLLLIKRMRKTGMVISSIGLLSLLLFSIPQVSNWLLQSIEQSPALDIKQMAEFDNTAIVVLGGGQYEDVAEYGVTIPAEEAVARVTYGAWLQRQTSLPLMLTGGKPERREISHAQVLANYMQQHLLTMPKWLETQSRTTFENAKFGAEILRAEGIEHVVLVTHSAHMRRAVFLFESVGLEVTPAPINLSFANQPMGEVWRWVPSADALKRSSAVVHEILGYAWYQYHFQ